MDVINKKDCQKILDHYGANAQIIKAIEEMSELQKELCKGLNGGKWINVSSEMADVYVMLTSLCLIFGNEEEVMNITALKIERTLHSIT